MIDMIENVELFGYDVNEYCGGGKPEHVKKLGEEFNVVDKDYFRNYEYTVWAELKKEQTVRFYVKHKKSLNKVAEMWFPKDEIVKIFKYFYVNPTLDFNNLFLYFGVKNSSGIWEVLPYSFATVLHEDFAKKLDINNYPALNIILSTYSTKLDVIEKNKRIHFELNDYHETCDCGRSENNTIPENQEYEGILFSRRKSDVEYFVEMKNRAVKEKRSELYMGELQEIKNKLSTLRDNLNEKENKEELKELEEYIETFIR
jgi:hypothetical protein